jgi:DNA-3-methyladenine glycosylase II
MLPIPFEIPLPTPYRWDLLLAVLSRFAATALFRVHEGAYYRAFRSKQHLTLVRLQANEGNTALQIQFMAHSPSFKGEGNSMVSFPLTPFARVVGATPDMSAFYAYARTQPDLWAWVEPIAGMPNFHSENLYEALLFTIIEQHISWASALKIQARFVDLFGDHIEYEGVRYGVLPTPAQLAALTRDDLLPLKLTMTRLDLLIQVANLFVERHFDDWESTPPQAMYTRLLALKGIGHWTAAVTVARAYGVSPFIHDNDVALQAAVNAYLLNQPKRASRAETLAAFAPYAEHGGTVANLLMMRWVLERYQPIIGQS